MFMVVTVLINMFGVKIFGEFESWLSSVSVLIVLRPIILLLVIIVGEAPSHDHLGVGYWSDPGTRRAYSGIDDEPFGRLASFINVLVTELVGVIVAKAENPRRNVPRAIKLTFYRILIFYELSVFLQGTCVAYDHLLLISATSSSISANASPFVVAIKNAKIGRLDHAINACILVIIFSAVISDLCIGSRTLDGLTVTGRAPRSFAKTNRWAIPYYALMVCGSFSALAYMSVAEDSQTVFSCFVSVVSFFGVLTWISILITHIFFTCALN